MGNRFVTPEAIRLHISDGDFIDIKKRLNHGEYEDLIASVAPIIVPGEPAQFNRRDVRTAEVLTYLLGWSLTDGTGAPVSMSPDVPETTRRFNLRNLSIETFNEIYDAIQTHVRALESERAEIKKNRAGANGSNATLPSLVGVTGAMSGSPS